MEPPRNFIAILSLWAASCCLALGAGTWNGIAFTGWNGVAITAWNGTGISAAGGGSGIPSDIKTGMVAWYDFSTGGTKDLTDAHGANDLTETGTVTATGDYLTTSNTNYVTVPAGLSMLATSSDDGTFMLCYQRSTGTTIVDTMSGSRLGIKSSTADTEPYVEIANHTYNAAGGGGITSGVDYIVGVTLVGSTDTVARWVNGIAKGSAAGGTYTQSSLAPVGNSASGYRIYWLGFWSRKLTDADMLAMGTQATSLKYSDLP